MDCKHIQDLLKAQVKVIQRHVAEHQWFHQIENKEKAIQDFIEKYGWLMREMFCDHICTEREHCKPEHLYFNKEKK